jgi:ADP-ribose pyrophosphatase
MDNKDLKKLTDCKWINLYSRKVRDDFDYYFCSRRSGEDVAKSGVVDAVRVLPYLVKEGKTYVVVNSQFRYAVNNELNELCAGLVENGEDPVEAAKREVMEETGGRVLEIKELFGGYNSPGMSDEYTRCFIARVVLDGVQNLDDGEQISVKLVPVGDIPKLVENEDFCLHSKTLLMMFYYMKKLDNK